MVRALRVKKLMATGFKSFARKTELVFDAPITAIVGPNGSGKSNVVEGIRFVLGEQSMKSLRGKGGADLIFKGSSQIGKMNRAQVLLTFDNSDRIFKLHTEDSELSLDFNEIEIGREVVADGTNRYTINGNDVRHKDIIELIASVNIGSSGHHIISQGEADRLLSAHPRERKTMLEEALGLKVYHYRLKETERKLAKTRENMKETEILRREIAPHLRFLKKQVEKFEQAETIRAELMQTSADYLARERAYLNTTTSAIIAREEQLQVDKVTFTDAMDALQSRITTHEQPVEDAELVVARKEVGELQNTRQELLRKLGRIEGMIEVATSGPTTSQTTSAFSRTDFEDLLEEIDLMIEDIEGVESAEILRSCINDIRKKLSSFGSRNQSVDSTSVAVSPAIDEYRQLQTAVEEEIAAIDFRITSATQLVRTLESQSQQARAALRDEERHLYEHKSKIESIDRDLAAITSERAALVQHEDRLLEEEEELKVLLGSITVSPTIPKTITPAEQETLRRHMERLKIKLEELGGGSGADVMREYEETSERDGFLARELGDLTDSMDKLEQLMDDLHQTLARDFAAGLKKINTQFAELFSVMFGGGKANLEEVTWEKRKRKSDDDEVEDIEEGDGKEVGIDIKVSLPRKKVSDLDMLSGGERSLTSIALLFALSQVNPPPFLVLDETDAALDEANSRKYGDMIETLSESSQLIVVTHNRETMSRAHVLYGVTLGSDDSSKLLSVKLDEAVKIAK